MTDVRCAERVADDLRLQAALPVVRDVGESVAPHRQSGPASRRSGDATRTSVRLSVQNVLRRSLPRAHAFARYAAPYEHYLAMVARQHRATDRRFLYVDDDF